MNRDDQNAIRAFADALSYRGPERAPAEAAYYRGLAAGEIGKNPYMNFMSEVLAPVPDLVLRAKYRKEVLHG